MAFLDETGLAVVWDRVTEEDDAIKENVSALKTHEIIKSFSDVSGVTNISLDVSDVDWERYENITLEFDAVSTSKTDVYFRLDNVSASKKYSRAGSDNTEMFSLQFLSSANSCLKHRVALTVEKMTANESYYLVYAESVANLNDYNGTTSLIGGTYGYVKGQWCTMSTINLVVVNSGVTANISNIVLRGVKR